MLSNYSASCVFRFPWVLLQGNHLVTGSRWFVNIVRSNESWMQPETQPVRRRGKSNPIQTACVERSTGNEGLGLTNLVRCDAFRMNIP